MECPREVVFSRGGSDLYGLLCEAVHGVGSVEKYYQKWAVNSFSKYYELCRAGGIRSDWEGKGLLALERGVSCVSLLWQRLVGAVFLDRMPAGVVHLL